ncbi:MULTISPECIES: RDD family protein [unclassified Clostridium]|uniref:RDD family protein n=1 Tax=unclassified Clostridium TaxID=2614128 RepID=UPI00189C3BF0|nr:MULTISPECIES: RDD family protein [unclassified Clostridium]
MVDREDVVMNNEEGMANNEIINNEEVNNEEVNNEEVNNEEVNNEEVKEDGKAVKFIKRLLAATIDQIVAIALALLLLLVFDFLLKFAGFYIAQRQPMFLIIYVITNILYSTICESTKLGRTIGKKTMLK